MVGIGKGLLFAVALGILLSHGVRAQDTCNTTTYICAAATANESDVSATLTAWAAESSDAYTVTIPACSSGSCVWTSEITMTLNNSLVIEGAGAEYANSGGGSTSGTDQTIITYNVTPSPAMYLVTASNKSLRITGIAFIQASGANEYHGMIQIDGSTAALRVDHCHFSGNEGIELDGGVLGVADHDVFDTTNVDSNDVRIYNGGIWNGINDGYGNESWVDGDHFGSNEFFFMEDDQFNNGYVGDCSGGGRFVLRYSTLTNTSGMEEHGVNTAPARSCRAAEAYMDQVTSNVTTSSGLINSNGGATLIWGNTLVDFDAVVNAGYMRSNNETYNEVPVLNGFGYCGGAPYATGTASVSANSTAVTGTGFSTGWPSGSMIYIPGASCTVNGRTGPTCEIQAVSGSTSLTLASASTAAVTNGAYAVGSPWDGNANSSGYPCLDAPGRGAGQLLTGSAFPNVVNSVTSTQSWPNQALDPIYAWDNSMSGSLYGSAAIVVNDIPNMITDNVDYYQQFGTYGESGSFNGTKGIGQGSTTPTAAGYTTCAAGPGGNTPGVGWWDTSNSTLYVCTATNIWTAYYTPYTYPNPLTQNGNTVNPPTNLLATPH